MKRTLFRVALLAYPRAFRRRFGAEMLADLEARATARASGPSSTRGTLGTLGTLLWSGLAERGAATKRFLFWPNHRPHLYEPSGRHFMFWDTLR